MQFQPGLSVAAQRAAVASHGGRIERFVAGGRFAVVASDGADVDGLLRGLAGDDHVAVAEANRPVRAAGTPTDPSYVHQAPVAERLRLPAAWDITTGSEELVLAVVDSGVNPDHPDLAGRLLPGWDVIDRDNEPDDEFGHGTQVTTVAAATGGDGHGIAGVVWKGKVLPVKVLDETGQGRDSDIAEGIFWAVDHSADVINVSIASSSGSTAVGAAIEHARQHDVVVVAAAGNDRTTARRYPAAYDGVVAVAATGPTDEPASFSNSGWWIDLAAPGEGILTGWADGTYRFMDGTSFAAPYVAGVAMLARARYPADTADQIVERLRAGAWDLGAWGFDDRFGYGALDAVGALGGPPRERPFDAAAAVHEPDNTLDRSTPVPLGGSSGGHVTFDDLDWFHVDVTDAEVAPDVTVRAETGTAAAQVFSPDLRPVGGGPITAQQGRWYVRVTGSGRYSISAASQDAPAAIYSSALLAGYNWPRVRSVAVADVTADGRTDWLFTTDAHDLFGDHGHELQLVIQKADGDWTNRYHPIGAPSAAGGRGLATGDLDADGDIDVAVSTLRGVEIFLSEGGQLVGPTIIPVGDVHALRAADLDADTTLDLLLNTTASGLRVLWNNGDGTFRLADLSSVATADVDVADFDADGTLDAVALECPDACTTIAVYRPGSGAEPARHPVPGLAGPDGGCTLGAGDLTRDGRVDVLTGCRDQAEGVLLTQTPAGTLLAAPSAPAGRADDIAVVDLTDDGRAEAVVASSDGVEVYRSAPGGLELAEDWGDSDGDSSFGPDSLAFGDVDGDGVTDYALAGREHITVFGRRRVLGLPSTLWVRDVTPADGSHQGRADSRPTLRLSRPIDPASVPSARFVLTDVSGGIAVPIDVTHDVATNSMVLAPRRPLVPGRVHLIEASGLRDAAGAQMAYHTWRFAVARTPAVDPPVVVPADDDPPAPPELQPALSDGYWMLGTSGVLYPFGDAVGAGDAAGKLPRDVPAVDIEPAPGGGYWIADAAGAVHAFGGAEPFGHLNEPLRPGESVTSLSATPTGRGYWLFTTAGRVVPFGDATWFGDLRHIALNGPVLDSVATPSGRGYYLVASDGGVFAFGDARFAGSTGDIRLNAPVQSLVPDPDGAGYWLVASDGGVFAFDAHFQGSMGDIGLNAPVTGMVPYGNGYLMVATDGGIFNFSNRPFLGSLGANPPAHPIVAVAAPRP